MSRPDDYRDDVSNTEFVDQDVERLIAGRSPDDPDLGDLAPFIDALRSESSFVPSSEASDTSAASAAAIVRSGQHARAGLDPGKNIARPGRRPSWHHARAAFALSGFALLVIAVGLGVVAHTSVPGDPLYGVDVALEQVGIGDGSVGERLHEADVLVASGEEIRALVLLGETYERLASEGDALGAEQAEQRLTAVASVSSAGSVTLKARIDRVREFIAENAGPGVGLDGAEFDRALAEVAADS